MAAPPSPSRSAFAPPSPGKLPPLPPSSAMASELQHPITPPLSQSDAEMVFGASTTSATTPPPGFVPYVPPATRPGKVFDSRIIAGSCFGSKSSVHPPQGQTLSNSIEYQSHAPINYTPVVSRSASAGSFFSGTATVAPNGSYLHPTTQSHQEQPNAQHIQQSMNERREHEGRQTQPATSKFFDSVASIVGSIPGLALFALPLAAIALNSNMRSLHGQCISLNKLTSGFVMTTVMACALFIGNHLVGQCLISYGKATGKADAVFDVEKNRRIFMFFLSGLLLAVLLLLASFILFLQLVFGTGFCHLLGGIFTIISFILVGAVFAPGLYGIFYLLRFNARSR